MGIDFEEWKNRIANRSDLTGRLTHLTRPAPGIDLQDRTFDEINILAVDNLIKILQDKKLNGSTKDGYIVGDRKAVCFQDAPLYALIQNVEHEKQRKFKEKLRYCGVGLSFVKPNLYYYYGARSVIYEKTETAKKFLPPEEWWRIVDNEYTREKNDWDITDWTHEREWRVPGDMKFEYNKGFVHIILYNPSCVSHFFEKCPEDILKSVYGITTLTSVLM